MLQLPTSLIYRQLSLKFEFIYLFLQFRIKVDFTLSKGRIFNPGHVVAVG